MPGPELGIKAITLRHSSHPQVVYNQLNHRLHPIKRYHCHFGVVLSSLTKTHGDITLYTGCCLFPPDYTRKCEKFLHSVKYSTKPWCVFFNGSYEWTIVYLTVSLSLDFFFFFATTKIEL